MEDCLFWGDFQLTFPDTRSSEREAELRCVPAPRSSPQSSTRAQTFPDAQGPDGGLLSEPPFGTHFLHLRVALGLPMAGRPLWL